MKKIELNEDQRRLLPVVLKSFEIEAVVNGDKVTLEKDELTRVPFALQEQHHIIHQVRLRLQQLFPVTALCESLRAQCKAFHDFFPISPGLGKEIEKISEREQSHAAAEALASLFASVSEAPDGVKH